MKLKRRVYDILEPAAEGDVASRAFDFVLVGLIALNVLAVILATVAGVWLCYAPLFNALELFTVVVFSVEYLLRLWTCTADARYRGPVLGRLKYALTPLALVDLLAVLPFYLPLILPLDLRVLRALRLFRIFRLVKIGRHTEAMHVFGRVFRSRRDALVLTAFTMALLLIISSSLMYYFENAAQPEAFASIPVTLLWGVNTLTAVGYGNVYPVTAAGSVMAAVVQILAIGFVAVPTSILGSGFIQEMQSEARRCPHCGKDLK